MPLPKKSCAHCGHDLNLATDVRPGLCPNCGRRWVLPGKRPLDWVDCVWAAFTCCLLVFFTSLAMKNEADQTFIMAVFLLGVPNCIMGFFTAGFFSRTVWAQMLSGVLLGAVFSAASWGLIYAGWRRL